MIVSSQLFEAHLECVTKCWLRSRAEPGTGNFYADWARRQNETYLEHGLKRSFTTIPESDRATAPPIPQNRKDLTWYLAIDVRWRTRELESRLQAVERISSEGHGRLPQFIPYRFEFVNRLTKEHKLLLAFEVVSRIRLKLRWRASPAGAAYRVMRQDQCIEGRAVRRACAIRRPCAW